MDISEIRDRSGTSFKKDIETSLDLIRKYGFKKVLYVDLTRSEIQIPVVRVIIPGLEVYSVDSERMGKRLT
jgi:thioglycine synthase